MVSYKSIINQSGGRFSENDVIIGAELALGMPERRIDKVNLQQSSRISDSSLYSKYDTSYQEFWTKINNFEPPEAVMKLFAVAIQSYLWEKYRKDYEA
jgi:hypothetical protein